MLIAERITSPSSLPGEAIVKALSLVAVFVIVKTLPLGYCIRITPYAWGNILILDPALNGTFKGGLDGNVLR